MFFVNFVVQLMTTGMIQEETAINLSLIRTTIKEKLLNDVRRRMKEMMKRKRANSLSVERSPEYDSPPHLHHFGTEKSCRTWSSNLDRNDYHYFVWLTMAIMKGLHLIALIGENFPVWFSSEVRLRKELLQMKRWSLRKIPFLWYSSSHISSSFPSEHCRKLSHWNFFSTQIFLPANSPPLAVHITSSSFSQCPPDGSL